MINTRQKKPTKHQEQKTIIFLEKQETMKFLSKVDFPFTPIEAFKKWAAGHLHNV